jgi:hypothetical protein
LAAAISIYKDLNFRAVKGAGTLASADTSVEKLRLQAG